MDVRELLLHIRAGSSDRQIERDMKVDRRTVKRYREWAEAQGVEPARRQYLDGKTPLEIRHIIPVMGLVDLSPQQLLVKDLVLFTIEWTVDVRVVCTFTVA